MKNLIDSPNQINSQVKIIYLIDLKTSSFGFQRE